MNAGGQSTTRIKVEGLKDLISSMEQLDKKIKNKIISQALRKGAKLVQKSVKAATPLKSGRLRGAIKVRAGKRKQGKISMMVSIGAGYFQGDTFYGAFLELGHKIGKRKGAGEAYHSLMRKASNLRTERKATGNKSLKAAETTLREQAKGSKTTEDRKAIPGKHFIKKAFQATGDIAAKEIELDIREGIEQAVNEVKK